MGRKIPAKKHRGVKDPLVQQARRLQSLKGKINAPPKDPDDQPVPKTLTRLFAFQNRDKTIKKKTNKKLLSADGVRQSGEHGNPVARLKQLPGESGRGFSLRINSAVRALHHPLHQINYPDDVESEDEKGSRMTAQRERRRRKRRGADHQPRGADRQPAVSRTRRLALQKREKKNKAVEEASWTQRAEAQYERVAFGDVAHAPPALRAPTLACPKPAAARRGLLLAAMLGGGAADGAGAAARGAEMRERARLDAVAAYRALKKERRLRDEPGARPKPTPS
ncbi:uncharacterized protein LOC123871527 isoform X2 [Maniola jurtina]|uniref:uncharacterized protein LOC123871527 isoform X2 n=1 Tax=Maniola jurtina TaxID=191418 RepID=UPI001E68DEFD|nr:uncharacterized protein LOC123871527 isoform X2 [Maniola jurtina]